jgi:hypothetical protein
VDEKVTVMMTGAESELELVGESVDVSVVVCVLAVAIGENIVEEDELADAVTVVVTFAATEATFLLFCGANFYVSSSPRPKNMWISPIKLRHSRRFALG